jgi:uncharacterized protein YkwD
MTMKRVSAMLLVTMLATIAASGVLFLVVKEAEATLVGVPTCDGGTITLNAEEKRVLELHSKARTERGLKALCVNPKLTSAARAHSKEMLDQDYTSHNSLNGETVKQRLERFGYTSKGYSYYLYGENIAWGCGSYGAPDSIFNWWKHSSGHRSNILKKSFREVGIGVLKGTYKSCNQATMYTVDFGVRRR